MQSEQRHAEVEPHHTTDRQTKRHILTAAEQLFLAKGYKGVSMKDIADAVHVKPAALYYHFPQGKEELFVEMLSQVIAEATEQALAALAASTDFRERLTLLTQSLLAFPIDRFSMLIRDAHEHLSHRNKQEALFLKVAGIFTQRATEFFQQAIDAGEITGQTPASVLALLHQGMCVALLNGRRFAPELLHSNNPRQLADMLVSALLDGVTTMTSTET